MATRVGTFKTRSATSVMPRSSAVPAVRTETRRQILVVAGLLNIFQDEVEDFFYPRFDDLGQALSANLDFLAPNGSTVKTKSGSMSAGRQSPY